MRAILLACFLTVTAAGASHRVLYITHSAGYRHDSIETSARVLQDIGARTGTFTVSHTEDLREITAENLRNFDAVLFFTSGELALDATQRQAFLNFIRSGGGFAGFHSATDTLYLWPEYGDLIGGYFDGHPWVQPARVSLEDRTHPGSGGLESPFQITEEFYQFRNFSRDRVHVLMSLDTTSVDLAAPGAHTGTTDFPLSWVRNYGRGRVFYTALGHFDTTWQDPRFQRVLEGGISWIVREASDLVVGNSASMDPLNTVAPGSLISIYGSNLKTSSGETSVTLDGVVLPLLYMAANQINAMVPWTLTPRTATLRVSAGAEEVASRPVSVIESTPGIFAAVLADRVITVWATGLTRDPSLTARVGQVPARVLYTGVSPEFPGLFQINVEVPENTPRDAISVSIGLSPSGPFITHTVQP